MHITDAVLETVIGITTPKLPVKHLPEVALAGRSNVGKSSFINALTGRKKLAYTSQNPGKTQTVNYYRINSCVYLVDLPGYGYAKNSAANRQAWGGMIQKFLTEDEMLRYVFLLVDIRHDPTEDDRRMYDWLKYIDFDPVVICTKADKLKPREIDPMLSRIRDCLGAEDAVLVPFSAVNGEGIDTVNDFLDQVVENETK